MGLSQSQPGSGASSGPTAPPLSSMAAYFHSPPSTLLTHDHPMPACEGGAVEAALAARLPPDIVQRILDLAGVWTACRRTNRRLLVVQAGGAEPHGRRGSDWRTGQEEEVTAEIAAGQGLEDGPGNVWYLVSAAVGCISGSQAGGREREDWEATDGPAVLGAERAAWMAASREARLAATGGGEGGGGEEEEGEGALTAEEVEKERGDKIDGEEGGRGAESRPSPAQESRQRWWLRKVVLETYSRDQGWTVNDDHYGTYVWSYSWFELSLLRDGREVPGSRHLVQFNVVAGQYFKVHRVELDESHPLVQAARDGDRVVVWARAMEPGWQNVVNYNAVLGAICTPVTAEMVFVMLGHGRQPAASCPPRLTLKQRWV